MLPIEAAILRTVLYADVFNFPLTLDEIHRYLISATPVSKTDIEETLQSSSVLGQYLCQLEQYICIHSRESIIETRIEREQITKQLWQPAMRYGQLLSHIPFVEMVALTGALAVRNPSAQDDDFDYLLITKPGRVWLARAFAVLLVRVVRLLGYEICPNYVLASDQLAQSRQDLYMAHEVAQMRPIFGASIYSKMMQQNKWMISYLPNAIAYPTSVDKPRRFRKLLEWIFSGRLGDMIESWEYNRKLSKFQPKMRQAESSAEINADTVKGHFEDHGMPVLQRYEELLYDYDLTHDLDALAGD